MPDVLPFARESVVQAVKSARDSAFRTYLSIFLAVLFFGGFLFMSFWEEYVLNRDTDKLLAYYEHVLPGSIAAGDRRHAMHIVYEYRGRKTALWQKIENKYGVPMREANEWDDYEADGSNEGKESIDLDNENDEKDSPQQSDPKKEAE